MDELASMFAWNRKKLLLNGSYLRPNFRAVLTKSIEFYHVGFLDQPNQIKRVIPRLKVVHAACTKLGTALIRAVILHDFRVNFEPIRNLNPRRD